MKKLMIRLASGSLYELKTDLTAGDLFTIDGLLGSTAYVVHDWNGEIAFTTPSASDWAAFTTTGSPTAGTYTDGDGNWGYANWITPGSYSITVTKAGYVETVVIGGGGGGGKSYYGPGGGGGEAGKVIEAKGVGALWLPVGTYQIVVGNGGTGGNGTYGLPTGGAASTFGVAASGFADLSFEAITALGGGHGGQSTTSIAPQNGGGGVDATQDSTGIAGVTGFIGANSAQGQYVRYGGGGAGNSGNGIAPIITGAQATEKAGQGGPGVTITITGV